MVSPCIRCGGCCQAIPCIFAQIFYNLKRKGDKCPALKKGLDGKYLCGLLQYKSIRNNPLELGMRAVIRSEMLNTGCDNPEFRRENNATNTLSMPR